MKQQSFTTPGLKAPLQDDLANLAMEQAQLQQQLQLQSGAVMAPTNQNQGGLQTLNLDGLANALAARRTKEALENNRRKTLDTQGAYQKGLVTELQKFGKASNGGEEEVPGPVEPGMPQPTVPQAGDQKAFQKYLNSPYPEVRAAAERQREEYTSRTKELEKRADFTTVQTAGGDMSRLQPKADLKEVNGAIMNMGEGQKTPAVVQGVTQQMLPTGTVVNQLPGGKQTSVDTAPKVSVSNNLPGGQLAHEQIKGLKDDKVGVAAQANSIRSTEQALNALQSGAKAGFGQDYIQNARTLVSSITGQKFDGQTETAVLAKTLAENVVNEFGGKLGSGVSNADVAFMQQAMGGLAADPQAIERILAIRAASALRKIDQHNAVVDTLGQLKNNDLGADTTRKLYAVDRPKFSMKFNTPEARASFVAGITGIPFEDALTRVQAEDKDPAMKAGTSPAKATQTVEDKARARMKELGLDYIPPAKGK